MKIRHLIATPFIALAMIFGYLAQTIYGLEGYIDFIKQISLDLHKFFNHPHDDTHI